MKISYNVIREGRDIMTNHEQIKQYWQNFCDLQGIPITTDYSAWSYGDSIKMADELAELTRRGIKTATTSAADLYEPGEAKPFVGEYNLILDGHGSPVCITKTRVVETIPYNLVSAEHAYHEGEGDRSLTYWQQVHEEFFKAEYATEGRQFNEQIPCICEVFEVVYA